MAYVVTEPCIKCKYTDCVEICPVMCFHEGENFLVINPDECIDCGACVDECPVQAIYPEGELPPQWYRYKALNRSLALEWPVISRCKPPLDSAEHFKTVRDKLDLLSQARGSGDLAG